MNLLPTNFEVFLRKRYKIVCDPDLISFEEWLETGCEDCNDSIPPALVNMWVQYYKEVGIKDASIAMDWIHSNY